MSQQFTGPGTDGSSEYTSQPSEIHGHRAQTAPALNPPKWSGKKTAIAAALALGIGGVTASTAAALNPASETSSQQGRGGPMAGQNGRGPWNQAPGQTQNRGGQHGSGQQPLGQNRFDSQTGH